MKGNTHRIQLRDGRSLAYSECGDPGGQPTFYFHGFPGSRLEAALVGPAAERLNVRVIGVDRPGYGLSDFKPARRIGDWPDDVTELADALGIDALTVVGVSGGGPYALACAAGIPDRLRGVGVVCGMGRIDSKGATRHMLWSNRLFLRLAARIPVAARLLCGVAAPTLRLSAGLVLPWFSRLLPAADRAVLQHPAVRSLFVETLRESARNGSRGLARDLGLYARPWGFRLHDVAPEVRLWHGERDTIVPPGMARALERELPRCRATYYPDEAHFSCALNRMEQIIAELIQEAG